MVHVGGKILRAGKYRFEGDFSIVDANTRVKLNCIRNITKTSSTLRDCTRACLMEPKCKSFNRHDMEGICELLAISKFDVKGAIRKELNWNHYDTDFDAKEVSVIEFTPIFIGGSGVLASRPESLLQRHLRKRFVTTVSYTLLKNSELVPLNLQKSGYYIR